MGRSELSVIVGGVTAVLLVALAVLRGGSTRRPPTSLLAPPPSASPAARDRRLSPLPLEHASLGSESAGLRALAPRSERSATTRGSVFFASPPPDVLSYTNPVGLRRPELGGVGDEATGAYLAHLSQDARGHDEFARALKRSGRYRAAVDRILQAWHLPADFGAIAFVLSGFQPGFVTSDGGAGLWSMPEDVARAYGLVVTPLYDERRGVGLATEVAAHYLADLHERFGSWPFAVCAYAIGYSAATDAAVGASADRAASASDLPPACTSFVRAVTAVATVAANPDRFGCDALRLDSPVSTSDLEVPAGAPFALVARAAGTTVERMHELNPEYLTGSTVPNAGIAMVVHVPGEGLARAKEMLLPLLYDTSGDARLGKPSGPEKGANAAASEPVVRAGTDRFYYRVQDGETIEAVADRFGVSRESLTHDNALDPTAGLRPGQLLLIHAATAPSGSSGDTHAHRGT